MNSFNHYHDWPRLTHTCQLAFQPTPSPIWLKATATSTVSSYRASCARESWTRRRFETSLKSPWQEFKVGKSVLVFNVGIPLFVLFLSSVHYLTTFCPFIVTILPCFCPCPIFDFFLFTKFLLLSTPGPIFVLSVPFLASFCPHFWLWFRKNLLNKIWSNAGPNILFIYRLVTL